MKTMRAKRSVVTAAVAGAGLAALVTLASTAATAQIKSDPRGNKEKSIFGVDWSKGDAPLEGEPRENAQKRLQALVPDPVKFPVPRTKWDGKPDFSGVYWPGDVEIEKPPMPLERLYRPEVRPLRETTDLVDWRNGFSRPSFHCIPSGTDNGNLGGPVASQLVHAPGIIAVFAEAGSVRLIPIDGRPRNRSRKPSFLGDSVGHWEGDTLVVELTNFKSGLWLGGAMGGNPPQISSDALRVVERWTRPDARILEYQAVIIEDSKMLTGPWKGAKLRLGKLAKDSVIEAEPCFEDPVLVRMEEEYQQKFGRGEKPR